MLLFQIFGDNPLLIIPWLAALLIAITVHEFSHGYAAFKLGDSTAADLGRLTLNPLAHLDVFGSLMFLLTGFGFAKPVPINLSRLQKGDLGKFIVSFAGIFSNIVIAVFGAVVLKILIATGSFEELNLLVKFLAFLIDLNLVLFVFNLIPIAPLDGYRIFEIFAPNAFSRFAPFMERWGLLILVILVFFTHIIDILIYPVIVLFAMLFQLPML